MSKSGNMSKIESMSKMGSINIIESTSKMALKWEAWVELEWEA